MFSAFKAIQSKFRKLTLSHFVYFLLLIFGTSCSSTKNMNYFPEIRDATLSDKAPVVEPLIQVNDLLSIIVSSSNPEASAIFNAPNESTNITSSAAISTNTLDDRLPGKPERGYPFSGAWPDTCGRPELNFRLPTISRRK